MVLIVFEFRLGFVDCTLVISSLSVIFVFPDDTVRESCGLTIQAMNRHSHDILKSYATAILPLVFLGMHDKKETGLYCQSLLLSIIFTVNHYCFQTG